MPKFTAHLPDGRTIGFEADSEPTEEEFLDAYKSEFEQPSKVSLPDYEPTGIGPLSADNQMAETARLEAQSPFRPEGAPSMFPSLMPEQRPTPEPIPERTSMGQEFAKDVNRLGANLFLPGAGNALFGPPEESVDFQEKQAQLEQAQKQRQLEGRTPEAQTELVDDINRRYNAYIQQASTTGRLETANALEQQRRKELADLGVETVEMMPTPSVVPSMTKGEQETLLGKNRASQMTRHIQNAVAGSANSFLTPEGMALGLGGVGGKAGVEFGKVIAKGFVAQMAVSAPAELAQAAGYYSAGDTDAGDAALAQGLATTTMLGLPVAAAKFGESPQKAAIRDLVKQLTEGDIKKLGADLTAQIRLQLPPRAKAETLPELARTQELVNRAVQEATQKIIVPGQIPAIELLKAQTREILPETTATLERPGGGEAMGGKVSFMRPAEAPLPERTQEARGLSEAERATVQQLVNEEATKGARYQVLPNGVVYRAPKEAPTQAEYQKRLAKESVEQGLTQESGYYTDEPVRQTLPEPEPQPERKREGGVIVETGTGRAIEKPIPLSALQRSRLRVALARGASEQTIINILRLGEKKGAENARSQQEAAEVHGNLQPLAVEGQRQVPTEEGGAGVQPRPEPGAEVGAPVKENVLVQESPSKVKPRLVDKTPPIATGPVTWDLYHGTWEAFGEGKTEFKTGIQGNFGPGVYVGSHRRGVAGHFGRKTSYSNAQVYPVRVQLDKPFDFRAKYPSSLGNEMVQTVANDLANGLYFKNQRERVMRKPIPEFSGEVTGQQIYDALKDVVRRVYFENDIQSTGTALSHILKGKGFDAIVYPGTMEPQLRHSPGDMAVAVFDPKKVKMRELESPLPEEPKTAAPPEAEGGAANVPPKGIITGSALEKWADDTLRGGATHAGPDVLAAYIVRGAALIERGIIDFAQWSAEMIKQHGEKIKPHLQGIYDAAKNINAGRPPTGTLKSASDIVIERLRKQTESGEQAKRLSAQHAETSPIIPEPVQERIKTAPESQYQRQSMNRVEDVVGNMSDAELGNVPQESNIFTASALERAKRLFNQGKLDEGYNVFAQLEKLGTTWGQLINQFKLLKGTTPEGIISVLNTDLQKRGRDPLTKKQTEQGLEIAKKSKDADAVLDSATDAWKNDPSDANAKLAEDALNASNDAALNLQRFTGKFQKKSLASILKAILQGGLLTPISQTANVFGNMSFLPWRAGERAIGASLDILDNKLTGRKRSISIGPISGTIEAAKGLVRGAKKIPSIMYRGQGDVMKGEPTKGLHPIRAWINQFSKNPDAPTVGGKLKFSDRVNLAIEGTFGIAPEMMLRMLGAGDAPFKEAARGRVIAEQLRLNNIPKSKWSFAQKFPELFFDDATMQQMHRDTMRAVFQRESQTLNFLTRWIRGKGETFDLAVASVAPYKLTPWNIIGEILSYNPMIAAGRAALEAKRGNSRAAKLNAGKMVVGTMLTTAGVWLYKNGLIAPSLDEPDEQAKSRLLAGEVLPPNHINISGLKRALKGGDPEFRAGDDTIDVFRAGGLAGAIFYMTANIGRRFEKMPEQPQSELWKAIATQSTLEQARFGMNQSFLSGVEGFLSAVKDGNGDNYVRQWMNTVASIPFPNSLAALSRATRDFKPDFREDTFKKQAENVVRNRLGFAGLDDYLPLKRDLWGRPMRETPEGRNSIIYQFFDITKNKEVTSDPVNLELYRLWRKTDDSGVIPSLPDKNLTIGHTTYQLATPQQVRFAELVGQNRRRIVDALVINPKYQALSDENKIKLLQRAYDAGRDQAKGLAWKEFQGQLAVKPQKAGFK